LVVAAVESVDLPMKKASEYRYLEAFIVRNGRCERIRTFDPLHPMQGKQQFLPFHRISKTHHNSLFSLDNNPYSVSPRFSSVHRLQPSNRTANRTANDY